MAPWPEHGNEPKAPDKEDKSDVMDTSLSVNSEETTESTNPTKSEQKEEKEVLGLDEGQLKALLDEAITYKNPKDREGKSELFKELLQEAEADESDSKGLGGSLGGKLPRYCNLPVRRKASRHGGQSKECGVGVSNTRGGSLQNLHALGMESGRRSRKRDTLVSARQREGGSLPTNVNVDNDPDLDIICRPTNYTSRATLEVSGPNKEETTNKDELYAQTFSKVQGHYVPNGTEFPNTKDEERNVETLYASSISVGPVESGAMLYPSTPVQHVSVLSIPPSQIHAGSDDHRISDSLEAKKLNVNRSRHYKKGHATEETENTSDGLLGLPLTAYLNRYTSFTLLDFQDANTRLSFGNAGDGKAKPLDENGNALACVRMDSNCLDRKKQRRVKAKNDRNTILSEEIEGFRGGADIDTLMEYIESPSLDSKSNKARTNQSNGTRNNVKVRAKEEEPRSIKRRKDKFQRCNSLEEISKTKLEDLTEEGSSERVNGSSHPLAKKQVTLDDAQLGKKSSWGDEVVATTRIPEAKDNRQERTSPEPVQDSEFHVVTKKQRKKKRRTGCGSRGGSKQNYYTGREGGSGRLLYQYHRDQGTSQPRRKSASSVPPSDKSDSSDLDSVHSLPVSSSATRARVGQNSASGGSTPQASYADIAKTAASPPDGSQVNIDRHERCSANSSFTEPEERTPNVPTPLLPTPPASSKKDAMTDTNCDNSLILKSEDYPPLDTIAPESCTGTVKRSQSGPRDTSATTDKVNKTETVIPGRDSGDGPHSLPFDFVCVKSPETVSASKRPP